MRVLEPVERVQEVLFGLIMVLTFTGSLSVAEAGREDVRTMLIGALGCNVAWGLIDAVFYLMGCLAEEGRRHQAFRAAREARSVDEARRHVAEALPPLVASVLEPSELDSIHARVASLPEPAAPPWLRGEDWRGAGSVFLLVFLSTLPVAIPFLLMREAHPALRVSNAVAIVLLYLAGHAFGRLIGRRPFLIGLSMVALGVGLVSLTMALGG
jgi:VIT1/CCC1 family predicted Fe2+/Mn2+ transporter